MKNDSKLYFFSVSHMVVPIRDLESLLIRWRKSSHAWNKLEEKLDKHLEKGVEICLKSLMPFLKKSQKKREALSVPFMLFCHNAFLADFDSRLKQLSGLVLLLEYDEKEVAQQLRTIGK